MEYNQALIRPRMSRVNWPQTITITLAAFVGCLVAMLVAGIVFKLLLSKHVQRQVDQAEAAERRLQTANDNSKPRPGVVRSGETRPGVVRQDVEPVAPRTDEHENEDVEETYVNPVNQVETIPSVA